MHKAEQQPVSLGESSQVGSWVRIFSFRLRVTAPQNVCAVPSCLERPRNEL